MPMRSWIVGGFVVVGPLPSVSLNIFNNMKGMTEVEPMINGLNPHL